MKFPRALLQAEGLVATAVALWGYATYTDASWLLLIGLWLVPDVGLLGFLAGTRIGSVTYNLTHTSVGPLALIALGAASGHDAALVAGLIWATHVGLDRALGYGLKSSWAGRHTHLQQLTSPRAAGEAETAFDRGRAATRTAEVRP